MSHRRKKRSAAVPEVTPQQNNQPRGLRVPEAAAYIGGTVNFVRGLIRNREIPALQLGKRHVLLKNDLDDYLDLLKRRA